MALWRYTLEFADGERDTHVTAAGNQRAALLRAQRAAEAKGARLVAGPTAVDAVRGSM